MNQEEGYLRDLFALVTRVENGVAAGIFPKPLKRIHGGGFVMMLPPEPEPEPRRIGHEVAASALLATAVAVAIAVGISGIAMSLAHGIKAYYTIEAAEAALLVVCAFCVYLYVYARGGE